MRPQLDVSREGTRLIRRSDTPFPEHLQGDQIHTHRRAFIRLFTVSSVRRKADCLAIVGTQPVDGFQANSKRVVGRI